MALTSGFFNSKNHDRLYDATQISTLFEGLINDGVYQGVGNIFKVSASNGMNVTVDTGRAWFNNTWTRNDALIVLTVPTAEQVLKRIDAVVIEVNSLETVRNNSIKIVKGTPASNPSKPSLTKNDDVHQYPLAYITVDPNVTVITQQKIQNAVGTSACPFVTGIIDTLDIDNLIAQWSSEFNVLFAELEDMIAQAASQTILDKSVTFPKLANDAIKRVVTNKVVAKADFANNDTYADYPYRAAIAVNGVTTGMIPEIIFDVVDAIGGNYSPVAQTYNGGVYIYAASPPDNNLTIPTIIVWREGVGTW